MIVRRLAEDGDIIFGYGNSTFLKDSSESVATILQYRFKLMFGEWMLNEEEGLDLFLGEMSKESIDSIVRQRILDTQDVLSITSFESEKDEKTRTYKAKVSITTTFGEINTEVTL